MKTLFAWIFLASSLGLQGSAFAGAGSAASGSKEALASSIFCEKWNGNQDLEKCRCEAQADRVVFSVDKENLIAYRKPGDLPAAEFQRLSPFLAFLWDSGARLDPKLKVAVKTSDGYCREASKGLADSIKASSRGDWERSESPDAFEKYYLRSLWEAAPKVKCAPAQAEVYPPLKPHYVTAPKSPADRVCRFIKNDDINVDCQAAGASSVVFWSIQPPGQKQGARDEFVALAPFMLMFWPTAEFKGLETAAARLSNGRCKTMGRAEGLALEEKWQKIWDKDRSLSNQVWMTKWFEEGWSKSEEDCPAAATP